MNAAVGEQARAAFFEAVADADEETAVRIAVDLAGAGVPIPLLLSELVAPAQRRVGERWADNSWNVAREHAATYVCDRVVTALGLRVRPVDPPRGRVVLACVDGDFHALAARMVGETLRVEGWQVTFLGASTPAVHLARFVHEVGPDAVALSCVISSSMPSARSMIEAVRLTGVPVLAGGPGFGPDGRWALRLGADAWAPDAAGAVARLSHGWPAFTEAAPDLDYLPDQEHVRLAADRPVLVERAMAAFREEAPAATGYSSWQLESTREDFGHIIDFLVAALMVDDVTLLEGFTRWLAGILGPRGVPGQVIATGYDILRGSLTGYHRAVRMLTAARALLSAPATGSSH